MTFEEATERLKETETELSEAQHVLQQFVNENFRSTAAGLVYVTNQSRDHLDNDMRVLVERVDHARNDFHHALAIWAGLKESRETTNKGGLPSQTI